MKRAFLSIVVPTYDNTDADDANLYWNFLIGPLGTTQHSTNLENVDIKINYKSRPLVHFTFSLAGFERKAFASAKELAR